LLDDEIGLVLVHDATPQQVADVRGQAVHGPLVAVQRQRKVLPVGEPEVGVEAPLELRRFALEPVGQLRVVPDLSRQAGAPHLGVVHVALDLTRGARQLGQRAVGESNRVPRVLPALVL
jgi:hypothetical protein